MLYELQPKTVYEWVTNWWPFLIGDWFWALFVAHREVVEVERNERHKIEPADPKAESRSLLFKLQLWGVRTFGKRLWGSLPEFRFCAHDCGSGQLVEGGEEAASFMTCAHCAGRTCMRHERTRWHDGVTCDEYDQALARAVASGDDGAEAALAEAAVQVKACPGCGTRISKADGCDVMRCCGRGGDDECRRYTRAHGACTHNPNGGRTHCGQRFCWLCLGKIDEDGTRHHARTCQWHESNL